MPIDNGNSSVLTTAEYERLHPGLERLGLLMVRQGQTGKGNHPSGRLSLAESGRSLGFPLPDTNVLPLDVNEAREWTPGGIHTGVGRNVTHCSPLKRSPSRDTARPANKLSHNEHVRLKEELV